MIFQTARFEVISQETHVRLSCSGRPWAHIVAAAGVTILTACGTTTTVKGTDMLNAAWVTCERPYHLTQDCSGWTGAKREVCLGGKPVKVAATEDGKVVLVMDPHPLMDATLRGASLFTYDPQSKGSYESYNAVRSLFEAHRINVLEVRPMGSTGSIYGYFLVLQDDGYSVLKQGSGEK